MKVDVEDYELEVLPGMQRVLHSKPHCFSYQEDKTRLP
jgi:hypothetical protein